MSAAIPASLARQVVFRANDACEYCKLPQTSQEATFPPAPGHATMKVCMGDGSVRHLARSINRWALVTPAGGAAIGND